MQTLVERMGELRLGIQAATPPVSPSPKEVVEGKGLLESKQVVPVPAPPPNSEWGVWVRGFGSGMRINNDVSRIFNQDVGGFQIGAGDALWSALERRCLIWACSLAIYMLRVTSWTEEPDRPTPVWALMQPGSTPRAGTPTRCSNTPRCGTTLAPPISKVSHQPDITTYRQLAAHWNLVNALILLVGASLSSRKRNWQVCGKAGRDYQPVKGPYVHGDDQTSLQGRLGGRLGVHFDLSQGLAIEPYAKTEVIEEFLTGNNVRTDNTTFVSSLSGTVGR